MIRRFFATISVLDVVVDLLVGQSTLQVSSSIGLNVVGNAFGGCNGKEIPA